MANNRPDWGAALQSLGQSLSGYAQADYERKRQEYEKEQARQQQLADRQWQADELDRRERERRAYEESLDPFVTTPPKDLAQSIDPLGLSSGSVVPLGNTPGWFPGLPEQPVRLRQSDLASAQIKWATDQENFRQAQELQRQQDAAALERTNAGITGRRALAAAAADAKRAATSDIYGGLPDAKAFNTFATSLVTPEELAIQGAGYQDMVTSELMKMAGEGYLLDAAAGAEAERRVRERITPTFSYLGQQLEYAPGAEYDGGTGQWYNPKAYAYSPPKERLGWLKDKKGELVPLPLEGAAATNVQQIQPFKTETVARDIIAPALEAGTISVSQLRKVSEKTGIPWEQLASYIPDAIKKAEAASSISSSLSKRAVADETAPTSVDWSLYQ